MSKTLTVVDSQSTLSPRAAWADWAGMIASIGCAIHCAAMPLVLAYLPSFGLGWLAEEGFHKWMALLCFGLAAAAFVPGWRKHGSFVPAIWAAAGLFLLTTAAFGLEESCCTSCSASHAASTTHTGAPGEGCALCELSAAKEPIAAAGVSWSSVTPFITPLGGLLLVVGHLLNHRKSCNCQGTNCCLTDDES